MLYKGYSYFGNYCSPWSYHSWNIWGIVIAALVAIAIIALVVVIIRSIGKKSRKESDDLISLLKAKYASGEISEEEYLRKRENLKK